MNHMMKKFNETMIEETYVVYQLYTLLIDVTC